MGAVNDSDPMTNNTRRWLNLGETIGPNQQKTFNFTLIAPPGSGTYTTDWRMVHAGVAWFGGTASKGVTVTGSAPPIGLYAVERLDLASVLRPGVRTLQASSYERWGGNNDMNNYLASSGGEDVLLDVKGAGCIYRIWWTNGDTYDPALRTIHIYFDGSASPLVSMNLAQFFAGATAPFLSPLVANSSVSSGGYICYLPMQFQTGCKITMTGAGPDPNLNWYNITYQKFPDATNVQTFTGIEDSSGARNVWNTAGTDPKPDQGSTNLTSTKAWYATQPSGAGIPTPEGDA